MNEKTDKIKLYIREDERYPNWKISKERVADDWDIEIEVTKAELIWIKWIYRQYQKVQYFLDDKMEEMAL